LLYTAHYNEFMAVKLARQLMEKETEKEESDGTGNNEEFNAVEETDTLDENCEESSRKKECSTDDMDQSETEMKD